MSPWLQMRVLHLINLGLDALPPAIGALSRLEELCLGRNPLGRRLDALPAELAALTALRRLELQYCGFEAGPPPIVGELPSLEVRPGRCFVWLLTCVEAAFRRRGGAAQLSAT